MLEGASDYILICEDDVCLSEEQRLIAQCSFLTSSCGGEYHWLGAHVVIYGAVRSDVQEFRWRRFRQWRDSQTNK